MNDPQPLVQEVWVKFHAALSFDTCRLWKSYNESVMYLERVQKDGNKYLGHGYAGRHRHLVLR